MIKELNLRASADISEDVEESDTCRSTWVANGGYIIPFMDATDPSIAKTLPEGRTYPSYCGASATVASSEQ